MIDQGTYRSSACPYECSRRIARHEVVASNEANMLSGLGLLGEGFVYPGHADDPRLGFSRFPTSGDTGFPKLHPLHMSHNVTLDQCDDIVHRHQLLSPHGVWIIHTSHEDDFTSEERLGDCGLFLGARSSVDADIWRAFYRYARLVLRLGHVDTWLDDDIQAAIVHSSAEGPCSSSTSKVCVWWSEFDLDEEEYSCRPKRDASNIITPAILLATLAENGVAYPPPNPPPPNPPASPPPPSPPPGALRCELSAIASTSGYKVPAYDPSLDPPRYVPVQKKCWRWDAANDWPPFVAHRDLYVERDRCSGARSRDVQWNGGFKQSLLASDTFDPLYQNNADCPWKAVTLNTQQLFLYTTMTTSLDDGAHCSDGQDKTQSVSENANARCDPGTDVHRCGIRKNLVIFGSAFVPFYRQPSAAVQAANVGDMFYEIAQKPDGTYSGLGRYRADGLCVSKKGVGTKGLWIVPIPAGMTERPPRTCMDGGPGSSFDLCYYGTDSACGKRRFAFELENAGPDVPDDSCRDPSEANAYGAANNICEDGLMWSEFAPGKNPCAPNTDVCPEFEPVLCIYTTQLSNNATEERGRCIPKTR